LQLAKAINGTSIHSLEDGLLPVPKYTERYYRVRRGDTLGGIARKYRVSLDSLKRANNIRKSNIIGVGQRLRIPGSSSIYIAAKSKPSSKRKIKHKVKRGESMHSIARKYSVSLSKLVKINRVKNPSNLRIGAILIIP
jgi:membrane-bound lytic murein transglycosylase D